MSSCVAMCGQREALTLQNEEELAVSMQGWLYITELDKMNIKINSNKQITLMDNRWQPKKITKKQPLILQTVSHFHP